MSQRLICRFMAGHWESGKKYDQPNGGHHFVNLKRIANNDARELMKQLLSETANG